jgi:hypothetical protein
MRDGTRVVRAGLPDVALCRFAFPFTIQPKKASPEMTKYDTIGICLADAYSNKRDT